MSYIIEIAIAIILLVAFAIGNSRFSTMSYSLKLIIFQLGIAFIVQAIGLFIDLNGNANTWLFNLYMPVELWLLGLAAYLYIANVLYRKVLLALLSINSIAWLILIVENGLDYFAIWAIVSQSIILTTAYVFILIQLLQSQNRNDSLTSNSTFWIAISIIIYFGCNIPLFSFLQYLMTVDMSFAQLLFRINLILCLVRYIITGYALYLARKEVTKHSLNGN